jgi:hypothetical protein
MHQTGFVNLNAIFFNLLIHTIFPRTYQCDDENVLFHPKNLFTTIHTMVIATDSPMGGNVDFLFINLYLNFVGLVIESATYGPIARTAQTTGLEIDVSPALQALVHASQLNIPGGRPKVSLSFYIEGTILTEDDGTTLLLTLSIFLFPSSFPLSLFPSPFFSPLLLFTSLSSPISIGADPWFLRSYPGRSQGPPCALHFPRPRPLRRVWRLRGRRTAARR